MPEHSKGALREYKRSYMAKRRASSKPQKEPRRDFQAEGYAERQIRKTLEMAGKIIVDDRSS